MKLAIYAYAAVLASIPITSLAQDAVQWPIVEGGNGHWYQGVSVGPGLTWEQASIAAEALGGHLATPSTEDENVWLFETLGDDPSLWNCGYGPFLGGYQDLDSPDYQEPDGGWRWINGEAWDYAGWYDGGPDNCCGGQANLQFGDGDGVDIEMTWNDVAFNDHNACFTSFLIEWSADCNGDGIVDYGQILDGTFQDLDGNGVPDCCDNGEFCGECRVDLTEDGEVNTLDFLLFLGAWSQGDPLADWDWNGTINTLDFLAYLNDWVEGC